MRCRHTAKSSSYDRVYITVVVFYSMQQGRVPTIFGAESVEGVGMYAKMFRNSEK